jgi:hypothetical protein
MMRLVSRGVVDVGNDTRPQVVRTGIIGQFG